MKLNSMSEVNVFFINITHITDDSFKREEYISINKYERGLMVK